MTDGISPLWKKRGMTGHDYVLKLRKILHTKKIGHGGTLDPDVERVLPICVDKGTKVIEYMVDSGKTYEGEITLGLVAVTEDISGEIVEKKLVTAPLLTEQIDQAMVEMTGEITQIPPIFSAVKVNDKRLYEYARNGEEVERPQRKAMVYSLERTSEPIFNESAQTQSWRFKVVCGKGTCVQTLSVDAGKKLNYPAHMSDLTRTASGGLQAAQCSTLEEIAKQMAAETIDQRPLPIETAVEQLPRIDLSDELYQKVENDMRLHKKELGIKVVPESLVALLYQNQMVSLHMPHPTHNKLLKPSKVLRNN